MFENFPLRTVFEKGTPFVSVEFFPPKSDDASLQFRKTAEAYANLSPAFVTITYGAGGSTRERSLEYARYLKDDLRQQVMPHLTCVGHGRDELAGMLKSYEDLGFRNLMALRGDPPKNSANFEAHPDGFSYASELVSFVKERFPDFSLGVGGYPEVHPEAPSAEIDILNLKRKVESGADFVTTQLFFDNDDYFAWADQCRKVGIHTPILPGIMPALQRDQLERICGFCGAKIPAELKAEMESAEKISTGAMAEVGQNWALRQITDLLEKGAPGIHLYALNRVDAGQNIIRKLQKDGLV
jgi:methylenetetrahydrofolate reductase (NADPH)